MEVWDERNYQIEKQVWNGTGALNGTIDNDGAVDNGDGTVGIPITGHGMAAGNEFYTDNAVGEKESGVNDGFG